MEIKIAKKTYIKSYIYMIVGLIIAFLAQQLYVLPKDDYTTAYLIIIVVLIIGVPMLLPVIPLKEHKVIGALLINENNFSLECNSKKETFSVTTISDAKIKLIGYNGQPWYKNMTKLGHRHQMNRLRLANGLGNYITFSYKTEKYKLELYLDDENEYNDLKMLLEKWADLNSNIKLKFVR